MDASSPSFTHHWYSELQPCEHLSSSLPSARNTPLLLFEGLTPTTGLGLDPCPQEVSR